MRRPDAALRHLTARGVPTRVKPEASCCRPVLGWERRGPVTCGVVVIFSVLLKPLSGCETLHDRVRQVLERLPAEVQRDFLDDPRFHIATETFVPGKGWTLWMPSPGPLEFSSRCVVLRQKLAERSETFAQYVIAHEFAHAYLRNGGWGEITDIEEAADALAASWGFRRG